MTVDPLTPARRREMTRRHLLDAAAAVFARNGFHGASLDEVAATAGFTKGAVYSNFKNKEDLFLALLDDRMDRQALEVGAELDVQQSREDPDDRLASMRDAIARWWDDEWSALYLEFVSYAARNPRARAKLAASAQRQQTLVVHMLQREYDRIGVVSPFPIELLAWISIALFDGLGIGRLVDPSAFTAETLAETLRFLYATIGVDGVVSPEE